MVGVGASAGGLEASTALLNALPTDTGMAFVIVHHLSPGRASMLGDILARATRMPVLTVAGNTLIEPNHVYVIPPDRALELNGGELTVLPRTEAERAHPIDQFLRSLAAAQGYKAIAVILSGTANDGTVGCEEIKAEGGITFAQDGTAQQESMPRSAITAGCVDFVLPPEEIAREIIRIGSHPLVGPSADRRAVDVGEDRVGSILEIVQTRTGVDFSHYKRSTLLRRIARRMVLHRLDGIKEYQRFLTANPAEVEGLFQDILINVTNFFRNPEGFDLLKRQVFHELTKDRSRQNPVRIWTLGCSTGEEAYSVAIAFSEFTTAQGRAIPVQVFASDLSPPGIEKARMGLYSKAIEQDVSAERLRRYFAEADGGYRIAKSLRDMVVFARHNALSDPPFSHIDLITCRNLLIYLEPVLQQRMIPILHYALNPAGYLWLGASETVGPFRNLFEQVDSKQKLYRRKPAASQLADVVPRQETRRVAPPGPIPVRYQSTVPAGADPQKEADRVLLSRYAPPGVLVDSDFDVLVFRGDTGPFLAPSPGRATLNLLKLLREGLVVAVRAALLKAKREGKTVRQQGLSVRAAKGLLTFWIEVIPVKPAGGETGYLVLFDPAGAEREKDRPPSARRAPVPRGEKAESEVVRLEQELAAAREYLQSVIEQQEAANEELQSANEEVQSANEELQSINEELETSKEEIQSSSEELATVNDELSNRNLELAQSNNDLTNLISSVQIPIVMLGPDFRVRRFTASAERLLNLIATDIGRPFTDIKPNLDLPGLDGLLAEVMETVTPREQTVRDRNGRWYSLRLRPYRTLENKIDGVVMMLVDIHTLKEAEELVRRAGERLAVLHDQAPLGIREVDLEGRFIQVNQEYCSITGYTREELLGRRFSDFVPLEERARALELSQQVLRQEIPSYREERRHLHKNGHSIWIEVHGFALRDESGRPISGVAFLQDITERRQTEIELRAADRAKNEFLAMLAHELRNPLAPLLNASQLLGAPNLDSDRLEFLRGIIERQIRNLSRMTDDLLDVSRISRGQIRLHREVIDVGSVVRRAVDLFRSTIESRSQHLELQLPGEMIYLDADPVRLEQVVDNLLTNASKFTEPEGHIRVSMARLADPAPGLLEIRVRDDGRGIAPELLPRVFDPFVQAEQSLDRTRGGLGIGLTLVRSLVYLHGGTVSAQSDGAGQGAEFLVRIPLPERPLTPLLDRRKASRPARTHRVLIVDDNPDAADTLAMLLRHENHEVQVAHDGEAALAAAETFQPAIVLLDIGLPGKDGIEVARELRQRVGDRKMTMIAVSGYGQEELRVKAREAGVEHYFTKPVDIGNLLRLFVTLP